LQLPIASLKGNFPQVRLMGHLNPVTSPTDNTIYYFPAQDGAVNFRAYYPYNSNVTNGIYPVNVSEWE
jgi:hypothetical protein